MTKIKVNAANKELRDIWVHALKGGSFPAALQEPLWPLQYPAMSPRPVLFVGLNPSTEIEDRPLLRIKKPFAKDLTDLSRIAAILQHQEVALGLHDPPRHRYYAKFDKLAGGAQWNHIDVLAVRGTTQAEVKEALGLADNGTFGSPFVSDQLEVILRLVDVIEPAVVVVVNAFASTMVYNRLADDLDQNDAEGFHFRRGARSQSWLFSGMVTGQRALDNHSFERLRWHLKRVLALRGLYKKRQSTGRDAGGFVHRSCTNSVEQG